MPGLKINCLLFIVLAIATLISHAWVEQYQQIGTDILSEDKWKISAPKNNHAGIKDGVFTLSASDSRTSVSIHQNISVAPRTLLKFSADVKHDDIVVGKKSWHEARLILVQNNGKKDRWNLPHIAASLTGTGDWENYEHFFYITPGTQQIRVAAELNRTTGTLQVKNIQLYPAQETPTYRWVKHIILAAWAIFFLLLIGSCLYADKKSLLARALLAAAFVSIVVGTSVPGYLKNFVSDKVETQLDADSSEFKTIIPWDLSKVWHVGVFFMLGLILGMMMKTQPLIHLTLIIVMMAGGTELVQLYINGRTPSMSDFFIDAAGGIVGIALVRIFPMTRNFQ